MTFRETMIKRNFPGHTLLRPGKLFGWSFYEMLTPNMLPSVQELTMEQKLQLEGLMVIMTLLVHSSNKQEQQRLTVDGNGCSEASALVHDLGSVLGHQKEGIVAKSDHKGDLLAWREHRVWKGKPAECRLNLMFHHDSWLNKHRHFTISEAGRKWILPKLSSIIEENSGSKLKHMLRMSGIVRGDKRLRDNFPKASEATLVDRWYAGFLDKYLEIKSNECDQAN